MYEYRCPACGECSSIVARVSELTRTIPCAHCGETAERILSRPSVHLSRASKLDKLDPKYDRMVDQAMKNTPKAEPDHLLKKMKPFAKDG
ncbi:MAG: hypothetical protein PVF57_15830 [Pseudomonadales bacterium]